MTTQRNSQQVRPDPQTDLDAPELDPDALAAIRTLLEVDTLEGPETVRDPAPAQVARPPEPAAAAAEPHATATEPVPRKRTTKPETAVAQDKTQGKLGDLKARITGYRPTRRHIILASIALVILLRPWLVFWTLVFSVFVMIGVFLILGYDGFWHRAMGLGRWYAKRRPSRAAELHRKLDAFAMKWDAVLDRFPEGSVDGLYLPDFGEMATSEQRHDDALDRRFANLRENEA